MDKLIILFVLVFSLSACLEKEDIDEVKEDIISYCDMYENDPRRELALATLHMAFPMIDADGYCDLEVLKH